MFHYSVSQWGFYCTTGGIREHSGGIEMEVAERRGTKLPMGALVYSITRNSD